MDISHVTLHTTCIRVHTHPYIHTLSKSSISTVQTTSEGINCTKQPKRPQFGPISPRCPHPILPPFPPSPHFIAVSPPRSHSIPKIPFAHVETVHFLPSSLPTLILSTFQPLPTIFIQFFPLQDSPKRFQVLSSPSSQRPTASIPPFHTILEPFSPPFPPPEPTPGPSDPPPSPPSPPPHSQEPLLLYWLCWL